MNHPAESVNAENVQNEPGEGFKFKSIYIWDEQEHADPAHAAARPRQRSVSLRLSLVLAAMLAIWAGWHWWDARPVSHGPGMVAPYEPLQGIPQRGGFEKNDYALTPVASFQAEARVLGVERYWFGREADLSPVDLALGWGRMSDESVLDHVDIDQSGRFYRWHVNGWPIPRQEIESNSANMHMIPSSDEVADTLKSLRTGEVVAIAGHLVSVRGDDGWQWNSSTTRLDTGAGACEIVYVEHCHVVAKPVIKPPSNPAATASR